MGDKIIKAVKLPLKSKSAVADALATLELLDEAIEEKMTEPAIVEFYELQEQHEKIEAGLKQYALDKTDYEDESYKITRVQGHRRWWDLEELAKRVPKGMLNKCCEMKPSASKIDELVKQGKLDRKKIQRAFKEAPNQPYALITKKSEGGADGEDEAASLAEKLA